MPSNPPTQAVILAGGQGIRLQPITDTIPKPLIQFHGRPFLSYLLDQVKDLGLDRVLLLIGYRGAQIREYCGNGERWGLDITYVESPVEADTGQRLNDAASGIDSKFLLMYCDNYCPVRLDKMWSDFNQGGTTAMVTAYTNRDGYTKSNLLVDENCVVEQYDPARSAPNLNAVDIGYAIFSKDVLDLIPAGNVNFEHSVYPILTERQQLRAHLTEHRYYSVGSHERLPLTEAFLKPQRAVILDRDGTLNVRPPQAHYVRSWDEFTWLPGAMKAVKMLNDAGYILALASNQSGIARGMMTEDDVDDIHRNMQEDLARAGAKIDAIFYCPHGWDDGCLCRKPLPGLLFQAQRQFHLDLSKTLFAGDDERDQQAGQAAGCRTAMVTGDRPLLSVVRDYLSEQSSPAILTRRQ
jgi:histidinol-phosphate phosphatase family protein